VIEFARRAAGTVRPPSDRVWDGVAGARGSRWVSGPITAIRPALNHDRQGAQTDGHPALAAFTIDVEDWYQSCVDHDAPITERVLRNVEKVVAVLDEFAVKGTFFVQGRVAEAFPRLLEDLVGDGHEIQSHGYSHRPLYAMNDAELNDEIARSRASVEDACGTRVTAFRAADFSILGENLWALEILAEQGFAVDSSIFPMRSRNYGIPGWDPGPQIVEFGDSPAILEVPVAVWAVGRWRLPVAGGGYFRIVPRRLLDHAVREVARARPAIVYCHPYEFSEGELEDYRGSVPRMLRVAQGIGRGRFVDRVRSLFTVSPFGRFDEVLRSWGIA
jgi:polysaccharide deacetylase family protein (PEP-CTERM system associated)